MTTPSPPAAPARVARPPRIATLDVLRGFALCGIIFANAPSVLQLDPIKADGDVHPMALWVEQLVSGRFFPLFSLLFGIGFGLMWSGARRRTSTPRVVLVRRLLALAALGAAHHVLQPGEALLPYAIVGLLVLLPATFLPQRMRMLIMVTGVALTVLAAAAGGGLVLVPGLFLIGFWLSDHVRGIDGAADRLSAGAATAFILGAILLITVLVTVQRLVPATEPMAGALTLVSAASSIVVITCALRTRIGPLLSTVLSPLGRLALTNYVTATLLLIFTGVGFTVNHLDTDQRWPVGMAACLVILVLQAVISRLWVTTVGQGPLEAAWRWATWAGAKPAGERGSEGAPPGPVTAATRRSRAAR